MTCQNAIKFCRKGQRLTEVERGKIAAWHSEGISNRQIAKWIGVAPQTIHNETKWGELKQVKKIKGNLHYPYGYNAEYAQNRYLLNRKNCCRKEKFQQVLAFLSYFVDCFKTKGLIPQMR
ncbi:MAG: helix-turn-helix domain-containing protein [Enterococcus sp.]|uniref:helix-turn-helix domain-containing protein n=1 Tax=Enterococcus sp. TaxID=35783 RepID=UPI0039A20DC6